jgi:hypothetical protein
MPSFLDMAGVKDQPLVDGKSLWPILKGEKKTNREEVFLERERHCLCRIDAGVEAGYPMRAIRTKDYLYIRNFRPNRNPAGDESIPLTPSVYGDVDGGPTKAYLIDNREQPKLQFYFNLGFGKRPAEELYVLSKDPFNLYNKANDKSYIAQKKALSSRLEEWMRKEKDPRLNGGGDEIDRYAGTTRAWITKWGIVFVDEK